MPYSVIASCVVVLSGAPKVYFAFFFFLTIDSANEKNFNWQKKLEQHVKKLKSLSIYFFFLIHQRGFFISFFLYVWRYELA